MEERTNAGFPAGAVGGVLAVAASFVGFGSIALSGGSLAGTGGVAIVLVFAAGVVALFGPRLVETLVVADALLALALLMEMFDGIAGAYLAPLVLLVFATMRSGQLPERDSLSAGRADSRPVPRAVLAGEWDRDHPTSGAALRGATSGEMVRRAG